MGLDREQLSLPLELLPFYRSGFRRLLRLSRQPGQTQPQQESSPRDQLGMWRKRLSSLTPPYSVVLTYWELALDLSDKEHAESTGRSGLFSSMLRNLAWSREEYVFWPLALPQGRDLVADTSLFWEAVATLRPSYVLLFGPKTCRCLFPERVFDYTHFDSEGIKFLQLPDPDAMLPDNRKAKNFVWQRLRSLPIPLARQGNHQS